ncbi:hypothetical protein ABH892_003147 [Paenibacillus sp. RC254]|uniref:Uncharacterized protein n=1 Tax=Paenibacillus terrae (strain HPL-003) TaxID=985665 RepID=G7VR16_PAETH|nr:hypothetical protein HPL003_22755 [Paenibacillus terrae HPL-003]
MTKNEHENIPDTITIRLSATWQLFQKIRYLLFRKKE